MLRLGRGFGREKVRDALRTGRAATVRYDGVLREQDIREAVSGVRQAGSPARATPILAWLASHPNAPEDVLRDLAAHGPREVLMNLCVNASLPADLRRELLGCPDPEVRRQAREALGRARKH